MNKTGRKRLFSEGRHPFKEWLPQNFGCISENRMKQVLRKGFKEIVVDNVPDPMIKPHHVLIRPFYSLISSGTETASIHQNGVLMEVAENLSQLRKVYEVMKTAGLLWTVVELKAKFSEYAVLRYSR